MTDDFDRLVAALDYPMAIVTAAAGDDGERSGCLVGFTTQASIKPRRWLVGLSDKNRTHDVALRASTVAVHFPTVDHVGLARLFGEQSGDEVDKFARCAWTAGPDGVPLLDDVRRRFVGRVAERLRIGDHTCLVVDVVQADYADGDQLGFQAVKDMPAGHAP